MECSERRRDLPSTYTRFRKTQSIPLRLRPEATNGSRCSSASNSPPARKKTMASAQLKAQLQKHKQQYKKKLDAARAKIDQQKQCLKWEKDRLREAKDSFRRWRNKTSEHELPEEIPATKASLHRNSRGNKRAFCSCVNENVCTRLGRGEARRHVSLFVRVSRCARVGGGCHGSLCVTFPPFQEPHPTNHQPPIHPSASAHSPNHPST